MRSKRYTTWLFLNVLRRTINKKCLNIASLRVSAYSRIVNHRICNLNFPRNRNLAQCASFFSFNRYRIIYVEAAMRLRCLRNLYFYLSANVFINLLTNDLSRVIENNASYFTRNIRLIVKLKINKKTVKSLARFFFTFANVNTI